MIDANWLWLIVPASVFLGFLAHGLCWIAKD